MEKEMENPGENLIIVTGPESTGKTTLAQALAGKYKAELYPEYAREYVQNLNRDYEFADILKIAEYQYNQFKEFQSGNKIAIFDTYLIITKVWFLWHSNTYPDWLDKAIKNTKGALYLLCAPDIAWIPDSVRENGGEARKQLFDTYRKELENYGLTYKIVTGCDNDRFENAVSFVESYLKQRG
jgi:NadR type nicotinamide-nucleotide adenylyltransferase